MEVQDATHDVGDGKDIFRIDRKDFNALWILIENLMCLKSLQTSVRMIYKSMQMAKYTLRRFWLGEYCERESIDATQIKQLIAFLLQQPRIDADSVVSLGSRKA